MSEHIAPGTKIHNAAYEVVPLSSTSPDPGAVAVRRVFEKVGRALSEGRRVEVRIYLADEDDDA